MLESKVGCVDQIRDTKFNLDIFEQTPKASEPTTKLVNREMLIFMHYQVDSKEIKCPFNGGQSMKPYFLFLIFWSDKF